MKPASTSHQRQRARVQRAGAAIASDPLPMDEEVCLLAPRQLSNLLRFAEQLPHAEGGRAAAIAAEWRRARQAYRRLEEVEAGAADDPSIRPWPKSLAAHLARLVESDAVRQTFNTVPVSFGMVELNKLVVSQFTLTRSIVGQLQHSLPPRPTPRRLADMCLPLHSGGTGFRLAYHDQRDFVFVADAHDMRLLAAKVVDADRVAGAAWPGHAQAAVALGVGFSANVLNVVRWGGRLILNNGHHRAHALRAMGVTHAPCLIQVCGSHDEVIEAATSEIVENSELYFEAPRPPLLRDFNNAELTLTLRTPRMRRELCIKLSVQRRLCAY